MGYKTVDSNFAEPWKPAKKGAALQGEYLGSDEIPSGRNDGKFFTSYRIRDKNGVILGVAGAFLDSKMNQVPQGAPIRVTYEGEKKTNNGVAKLFALEVDDSVELLDPYRLPQAAAPA